MAQYGGAVLESSTLSALQSIDGSVSSLTDSEKDLMHNEWGKDAWDNACTYAISQHPSKVEEGAISSGAITTETDAYWGMNHFNSSIKSALLNGSCLMPYYGMIPKASDSSGYDSRSRIIVIVNNKIFKFDTDSFVYFNGVKAAIPHYLASEYFTYYSESSNSTTATNNATAAYDDEVE